MTTATLPRPGERVLTVHQPSLDAVTCPGYQRHWFTEYGAPGSRLDHCARCGVAERDVIVARFWSYVDAEGLCWIWTGRRRATGYGSFTDRRGGTTHAAHRFAYELLVGPIPDGMELDHLCRVRPCVNPDHVEVVTPAENKRRGFGVNRTARERTHCPQGHPYSDDNIVRTVKGWRRCRRCRTEQSERAYARRKAG